ncbi:PLD nuclease N-terminal domain-containing protein [Lentzea sp. NPDC005914]|uniref:PLD nuclease N-terminal domain-containing protein n=1 Tax=Lentzea sp. NPDC005914 TaxID=3154572 RepID=UPI00340CFFE2
MSHQVVPALSDQNARLLEGGGLVLALLLAAALLIFWIAALVSVLGAPIGCGAKILWLLVVFALPFLGSVLWFVAGRRTAGVN